MVRKFVCEFVGHFIVAVIALPGSTSTMFSRSLQVLFLLVTMTSPPAWGWSLLWVCVNLRFGPYWAFRFWTWALLEWDSRVQRMVMPLDSMVCIMAFHLSHVE